MNSSPRRSLVAARWWRSAFLCAAALTPSTLALAQDKDHQAIAAEITRALKAREITTDQAKELIDKSRVELRVAVAAGEIGPAEARAILAALHDAVPHAAPPKTGTELDRAAARLKRAVAEGRLTEDQAKQRFGDLRQNAAATAREKLVAARKEMRAAIEAGKLTEEEGKQRLEGLRRRLAAQLGRGGEPEKRDAGRTVDWKSVERRIESAVERGDLTREQADAKYAELKKRFAEGDRSRER